MKVKKKICIKNKMVDADNLPWENFTKKPVVVKALKMSEPFDLVEEDGEQVTHYGIEGDYVIMDEDGSISACQQKVFEKNYERV